MWFSIFGQNNYISVFNPESKWIPFIYFIMCGFYWISMLLSLIVVFVQQHVYSSLSLIYTTSFLTILPNYVAIIESLVFTTTLNFILSDTTDSLDYLENYVNFKVNIKQFAQRFHKKLILTTAMYLIEYIVKFLFPTQYYTTYSTMILFITSLYKHIATMHAVLFIDIQTLILSSLNRKLNPVLIDSGKECLITRVETKEAMYMLHHIKTLYSKVWRISEHINKRFGCLLIVVNLQIVFNLVQNIIAAFYVYYSTTTGEFNYYYILCKLIFFLFLDSILI